MSYFTKLCKVVLASACLFSAPTAQALEPVDYLALDELTYAIRVAIRDAVRDQDREPFFLITEINLELKGVEANEVEGGFKIPIFETSASAEALQSYAASHALNLDLVPSQPIATRPVPDIQLSRIVGEVKDSFHCRPEAAGEAIEETAKGDADSTESDEDVVSVDCVATEDGTHDDLPDLVARSFTYTYSGALKETVSGGIDLILFSIGGSTSQSGLQTISFTLCRTLNKKNCSE